MTVIDEIGLFIEDTDNQEALIDQIKEDLKIENINADLCQLYDSVKEKTYDVSLEDIIKAVLKRVSDAVSTFKEE